MMLERSFKSLYEIAKRHATRIFMCLGAVLTMAFLAPDDKVRVFLVGDSTMSQKQIAYYPEAGWGMPFTYFFDESVSVRNHAMNGRSTRTFIEEGRWKTVNDSLKRGDYVFIQFGHNDEVKSKKSYVDEAGFKANLERFVKDVRAKNASAVLLTPVARRNFDTEGKISGTHDAYSQLVRDVAKAQQVPLIDLDVKSQSLLQQYGLETSKMLFLHLAPGEHPNYPEGKEDNTHFNELGARKMAELVLAEMRVLKLGLVERVVRK